MKVVCWVEVEDDASRRCLHGTGGGPEGALLALRRGNDPWKRGGSE